MSGGLFKRKRLRGMWCMGMKPEHEKPKSLHKG